MKALICLLLALMILPAAAETVQDQALAFIQEAGIGADAVSRIGNDIIVTLAQGGMATLTLPGDFDPFNLDWRFDSAADGDVALYLDHALTLLAALERKIPADMESLSALERRIAESHAAVIENGLTDLEATGEQGLRILQEQLSAQEETELDSLRARLMSRLQNLLTNDAPVE